MMIPTIRADYPGTKEEMMDFSESVQDSNRLLQSFTGPESGSTQKRRRPYKRRAEFYHPGAEVPTQL